MIEKEKSCCFTGNRPEKLNIDEKDARNLLCEAVQNAVNKGFTTFITGMAEGVDIWSGEIVLEFKNLYPEIKLICALPYPDFAKNASHITQKADLIYTVTDKYSPFCFQLRNEWMVDNSSLVIALSSGKKGGTENTIKYAQEKGIEVIKLKKKPLFKQLSFKKLYD